MRFGIDLRGPKTTAKRQEAVASERQRLRAEKAEKELQQANADVAARFKKQAEDGVRDQLRPHGMTLRKLKFPRYLQIEPGLEFEGAGVTTDGLELRIVCKVSDDVRGVTVTTYGEDGTD